MESNGPDGKVRGNAQQILDKYQSLARDATSAGEHISAEGFYQYAEHYQRVLNTEAANNPNPNQNQNRGQGQRDDNKASGKNNNQDGQQPGGAAEPAESKENVSADSDNESVETGGTADTSETNAETEVADSGSEEVSESEDAKPESELQASA